MNNNITSFVPGIFNLITTSLPAKIILAIVLLIIVLIVLLPLIAKLKRKKLKEKETRNIVRDLMVWRHIAQLARGGEDQVKAKEDLSDKLLKIDELLRQGFELASAHGRGAYGVPWFMMLGEPHSGKSSLLQESELDIIPSVVEDPHSSPGADQKSLPVRIWLGGKAVICDVSGSVFFDRWLGGSSAEWTHIIKELCRRHSRMPLNGVILTIPADALLSDSEDLTRKKAVLMANELARLLDSTGMRLPCYLVVTKLDMVEGFREYVTGLSGELRHQILGFENDGAYYDPKGFKKFWDKLLEKLRSGYNKALLSRDVALHVYDTQNRMDLTGKMFLFTETFASMYSKLNIYLGTMFSEDNFHGTKETIFEGLFFTSALDLGVSLSPAIAALVGKNTDDFPISGKKISASKSYFVRNMLQNFIFNPSPYAGFVRKKAISRSIPAFALCGLIIATGIILLITAIFSHYDVKISLDAVAEYYASLEDTIKDGSGGKMPVIIRDNSGAYAINNNPDPSLNGISPMQFYTNAVSYQHTKITPPMGFLFSSFLVFGEYDMGLRNRNFITEAIYGPLVRVPLLKGVGNKLIEDASSPPVLDDKLRSLIHSFLITATAYKIDMKRLVKLYLYSPDAMTDYILPDISSQTRALLAGDMGDFDNRHSFAAEMMYVNSNSYTIAKESALQIMLYNWENFTVYPDSLYGKLKSLVLISQNIVTNYPQIEFVLNSVNDAATLREVQNLVAGWQSLTQTRDKLISDGTEIFDSITSQMTKMKIPLGIISADETKDPFGNNLINTYIFNDLLMRYATNEYTDLFQRDMNFIRDNSSGISAASTGSIDTLRNDFSGNLNKEIASLRTRSQELKTEPLLSGKLTDEANAPSLFTTIQKILTLAGAVNIPDTKTIRNSPDINWMKGQYDIVTAFNNFENYVKPLADNEKVSSLVDNARVMLAAQAYLNRYVVLSTEYDFLSSSPEVIMAMIASRSENSEQDVFSLSGRAIQSALGKLPYNNGYDPNIVKTMTDGISAYSSLFTQDIKFKTMPQFLKNSDMGIYQTDAFSSYLDRYISYWSDYPDTAYLPVPTWQEYMEKVNNNKPYQINSVLQTLYTECIGILNDINDVVLPDVLRQQKKNSIVALNDKIKLLSAFLSADADRMLSAWSKLPADPESAFIYLRSLSKDEIKNTYMTVYSDTRNISIGWWNNFILDGINVLSKSFCQKRLDDFSAKKERIKLFPLIADGSRTYAMTLSAVKDLAQLLEDMGAGSLPPQPGAVQDTVDALLHPILFRDSAAQNWAETVYQFAAAVSNSAKPLTWNLVQPTIDKQGTLASIGRQLAVNRFRYLEVSTTGKAPKSFNTYMNEETTLATGGAADRGINLKFYLSSADMTTPQATVNVDDPWSIFDLYLNKDLITADGEIFFPVFINDELGKYAYFMEIEFKPAIPAPEKWYNSSTWPALVVTDGIVTAGY
jgi:hypothetical protein